MEIAQEALDKILEEIKDINSRAINHMRTAGMEQIKQLKEHYDEKLQELSRQNDGLLGAIGRLQAERDQAVKKLEEENSRQQEREQSFKMHAFEVERHMQDERLKTKNEISEYKSLIMDLQAKLKKQTKK